MPHFFSLTLSSFIIFSFSYSQLSYKEMMLDNSYNFYEVCEAAEAYFLTHDREVKGSGWKGYQRWRNLNEYKFYPDGDRSNVDPYFTAHAYQNFLNNNAKAKSLFDNGWEELGPSSIDSITGHYAAGLGRVEDFYIDPNNSNLFYLGSRSGGFWKSINGGQTWQGGSTDFLFASGVNTIAVEPNNSSQILINLRNSNNGYSHGIYESFNEGDSWNLSNFNPTNLGVGGLGSSFKIFKIAYHPTIPNLIFVGTNRGIYRSDDNLATWTRLYNTADITDIAFHPMNDSIVYILDTDASNGVRNFAYLSDDAGQTYSLSSAIPSNNNSAGKLSVSKACSNCLYFASNNGVWQSVNEGQNFTFLSNPSESCDGFAVNDLDTDYMIYGYVDLEATSDGGTTFDRVTRWSLGNTNGAGNGFQNSINTSTDYIHADLRVAKCVNGVFYVGTDGLFCKSLDNGITWEVLSDGLAIRENYKLGASQSNHYRTISGSQDNGTSIKHKNDWIEFYGADGMEGLIHPLNDDWMLGSIQFGSRRRTLDGGQTQNGANAFGQSGSGNAAWEAPITYDPNNHMRIYNFSDSIFVSDDFATNWTYVGKPNFSNNINQAAIAENNSNILVVSSGFYISKSTDGGATFSSIAAGLPNYTIEDIAFHPKNDDIIFVTFAPYIEDDNKIFMTTNGGNSWINITHNLDNMPIHTVVVDHTAESNIYVGAEIGVYTKPFASNTWTLYNLNLPNTTIEELEIVNGSNTLKAATWGRGLWEYSLVGRNDYPAILTTKITDQPTLSKPKFGKDQFVTSTIEYDNNLTNVYVEWSADTAIFGNVIPMTNTQGNTWVSDSPLPNLPIDTKLFFKVFAVGAANDTSETYKFMYTVQPFEYCSSFGTMIYNGNITLVDFESINNPSGKTQPYTNYSTTDSALVYAGKSYDLTVNLNTDNGNYTYYSKAWIDWNKDADFDDVGEDFDLGFVDNQVDAPTDLSPLTIHIPSNADLGKTTMRVACKYNQYPTPCEQDYDGEVEDYGIYILPPPNLDFTLNTTDLCEGENLTYNYTGDPVDAVSWLFSDGVTNLFSNTFSGNLTFNNAGVYSVSLIASINGFDFIFDSVNIFEVHAPKNTNISVITCDLNLVGTSSLTLSDVFGCDSIITTTTSLVSQYPINLEDTICFGEDYLFDNQNLTQSGSYSYTANSVSSCDTLYSLELEVRQIDLSVQQNAANLTTNQLNASYQWLDCLDSWSSIFNATNASFSPNQNGEYAVEVSYQNCVDTSACYTITNVGIRDVNAALNLLVYPNPFDENLHLEFESEMESIQILVYDNKGSLVKEIDAKNQRKLVLHFQKEAKGIYYLHITADEAFILFEVQKN